MFKLRFIFFVLISITLIIPMRSMADSLVIDRVSVDVRDDSVIITWFTNMDTRGRVDYGTTTSYGSYIASSLSPRTYHEITLGNLQGDLTYHFKISATTVNGIQTESFDQIFTTIKDNDVDAPVISNIHISASGATYFVLTWDTNEKSDSWVEYSVNQDFKKLSSVSGPGDRISREVVVKGLKKNTEYYYRPVARDKAGNKSFGSSNKFFTALRDDYDRELLNITQISPVAPTDPLITQNSIVVRWRTNHASRGSVTCKSKAKGCKRIDEVGYSTLNHQVALNGLESNSVYVLKISSKDILGRSVNSTEFFVTTLPIAPPSPVTPSPDVSITPNCTTYYIYGLKCRDLKLEETLSIELRKYVRQALGRKKFKQAQPMWPLLVNAYIYGDYPVKAIVQAIKFKGKTVHRSFPWMTWKESVDYKKYIDKK